MSYWFFAVLDYGIAGKIELKSLLLASFAAGAIGENIDSIGLPSSLSCLN